MAERHWVGGTANWDGTAGSKWSLTAGGVGGEAVPTTGDDVYLDASSGAVTITYTTSSTFGSIDCTGFTGTLTHNAATMTLDGSGSNDVCKFVAGMTYTPGSATRIIQFTNTSGTMALTCGGKTLGAVTQNGAGGTVQLQDAFTLFTNSGILTLTAGTFDANNQNVTIGLLSSNNSNTRVLTMGSGTWTFNVVNSNPVDCTTGTNLTVNRDTATMVFSASSTGRRTFIGGGKSWPAVSVVNSGSTWEQFLVSGSPTFASLSLTGPVQFNVASSTTLTVDTAFTLAGTSSNIITLAGDGNGINATISIGAGSATMSYCAIGGLTFGGGATFTATNSFNLGGNSGITISVPSGGGGGGVFGA